MTRPRQLDEISQRCEKPVLSTNLDIIPKWKTHPTQGGHSLSTMALASPVVSFDCLNFQMLLESSLYRDRDDIGQSASRKYFIWLRRKLKLDFFLEFNVCNGPMNENFWTSFSSLRSNPFSVSTHWWQLRIKTQLKFDDKAKVRVFFCLRS